jgi:hypothetical protein
MAAKLTVYPNSDSPSKVRPRIVKPASGMISPVNSAGIKTARVVVVYAELAQSYIAQPKTVRLSFRRVDIGGHSMEARDDRAP